MAELSMTPKDNRMTAVLCCAIAALLLAYAAVSHRWLENRRSSSAQIGISLRSIEICMAGTCEARSNREVVAEARRFDDDAASVVWAPVGLITMALSVVAALALLTSAALGYTKRRVAPKILPTTIALLALMITLVTGCVFIAKKPGGAGNVGVGLGFWAFGIGSVLGIAGAQLMNKLIKPVDPDVLPEEMV